MGSLVRACGGLGQVDPERIRAIARMLGADVRTVHEDDRSILALDREPLRWRGGDTRGLAWSELVRPPLPDSISSREAAAETGAACGLVLAPGDSYVHSSVSGIAPVYHLEADGAVYFATSVHALAASGDERLSVDWDAWASILTLNYPLGDRTPFAEIRRLGPSASLRLRDGRAEVTQEPWPWAEIEPRLTVAEGVDEVVAGMRAAVGRLPEGPVVCPLSGGWDSRICLALLLERPGAEVRAITAHPDTATDREQRTAARVAAAAGVPHEVVSGSDAGYFDDLVTFAELVDFQVIRKPWRMSLVGPLRDAGAPVVDGLALDTLAAAGDRFFTPAAVAPGGDDTTVQALWGALRSKQARRRAPLRRLTRALWASARRQHMASSQRFRGHDQRAILSFYLGRHLRGISQVSHCLLGSAAPVALPFNEDQVVRPSLAIASGDKQGGGLYRALFAALGTDLAGLPSNRLGGELPGRPHHQRSQTSAAADALADCLADGPLTPYLAPGALRRLTRHRRGRRPRVDVSLLAPAVFHLWHGRYSHRVGDADPGPAMLG